MHRKREAEMNSGQHQSACDDQCHAFAVFVVDESEERCHQNGTERCYRRKETCEVRIDTIFHHHQFCGKFQEGGNGGVEEYAEERDEPETWIAQGDKDVTPAEFIGGFRALGVLGVIRRFIQSAVHDTEDKECQQADDEKGQSHE